MAKNKQATPGKSKAERVASPKRLWILASGLAGIAVIAGAVAFGWGAANSLSVAPQDRPLAQSSLIAVPDYSLGETSSMPDVRGLTEQDATQALVDAGIPATVVTVEERLAAGKPGRVIEQTPVFGVQNPGSVVIVIALKAAVPDVTGLIAADGVAELRGLGARVQQVKSYVPGADIGTITETRPAEGEDLDEVVTVVVADSPSSVPFDTFERLQGSPGSDEDILHLGTRYDSALSFYAPDDDFREYSWVFGGRATSITGELTLGEDEPSDASAMVVVVGDGTEIARLKVHSTTPVPVAWDVIGVDTLTVRVTGSTSSYSVDVLLLNPEVLGSYDAMNADPNETN